MRALALVLGLLAGGALADDVPEPEGYRDAPYRAPVPETLAGALVLDDDAAHALWFTGQVLFVDVLPKPPKPDNLPEGTIWRDPKRQSIPGSVWLPNVGYVALHAQTDAYFREGLARLTAGNLDHPLVFFCLADCWMSWNAAKRAMTDYGYTRVFWYPEGTDGWAEIGHPLVEITPEP